jgi:hypothetical protein
MMDAITMCRLGLVPLLRLLAVKGGQGFAIGGSLVRKYNVTSILRADESYM